MPNANGSTARLISVKGAVAALSPFLMPAPSSEFRSNLQLLEACSRKLRQLLELMQDGQAAKSDIVPSLLNSARLLEKVFVDRSKGMHPDELEEDLFSVASAGGAIAGDSAAAPVPERVQEWLTATFTRRGSVIAAGGRRRLRSLATVVQTSVYFEKLFRSRGLSQRTAAGAAGAGDGGEPAADALPQPPPLSIPPAALAYLERAAHQWDFDPFCLTEVTGNRPIRSAGLYLFHKFDLIDKFSMQVPALEAFLDMVEDGYKRHGNPYHNCTHSADVAQTCSFLVSRHGLAGWLSDTEVLALLFAALIHDFEHTGTTNNFHVQSRSPLAVVYNDRAVLESHHVSAVFRRLHEPGSQCGGLLKCLSPMEYRQFRTMVIDMVLATDMSTHFAQVTAIRDAIPCPENLPRVDILAYILHAADISHPAKVWRLHERWTDKLTAEFFAQGDREKELGLPCSPLCDRDKTPVAASQVGFIEYIVEPCFLTLLQLLQGVKVLLSPRPPIDADGEVDGESADGSRPANPTPETMQRLSDLHDWDVLGILCANRDRWRELAEQEKRRISAIQEVEEEEEKEEKVQDE